MEDLFKANANSEFVPFFHVDEQLELMELAWLLFA